MKITTNHPAWWTAAFLAVGCQAAGELEEGPEDGSEDRPASGLDGPPGITKPGHSQQGAGSMPKLDTSFSGNGTANPSNPGLDSEDTVFAGALQGDGKILLGGTYHNVNSWTPTASIVRLDANGAIDTSFGGGDGFVDNVFPGNVSQTIYGIKALPDGRIVAAGRYHTQLLVLRLLADGSYDPSFNAQGWAQHPTLGVESESRHILALQGDGYVVAGRAGWGTWADFAVARYLPNGNLDPAFGLGGVATIDVSGVEDISFTLLVDPYNRIYIAGTTSGRFAVARLLANGAPDPGFGTGGVVLTDITSGSDRIYGLALDGTGRLVAVGPGNRSFNSDHDSGWALARYLPDGSLDPSFHADGILYDPIPATLPGVPDYVGARNDIPYAVSVRTNGDILVAGQTKWFTQAGRMLLARYHDDGTLDVGFDGDGYYVQTAWDVASPGHEVAHALLEQPDGKLVVVGNMGHGSTAQKAALRLQVEPEPWCPALSDVQTLDAGGATLVVGSVTATITGWAGATTDLRMTVHGSEAFLGIPAPDLDAPTCAGGVIELEPTIGDPLAEAPEVTLTFPCDPEGANQVEHGRSDGTYAYLPVACDEQTGEGTVVVEGYGYLRPSGSVPPGCEACPEDSGLAVCNLTAFAPLRGACYSAPNDLAQAEIGPAGGVLVHPAGGTLTIPAGALAQTTTVSLGVAWEKLPKQQVPPGGVPSWRLLAGEGNAELAALATFTFPCGPEQGRLRVNHVYDFQQEHVVTCSAGQASLTLDRLGYVQPGEQVETTVVDGQGGLVTEEGGAEVAIPAGALDAAVDIAIAPILDGLGPALDTLALGQAHAFLPHGQVFDAPVEFRMPAPGCVPGRIAVQSRDDEHDASWEQLPAECIDGFAVFEDDSFSIKQPVDTVAKSAAQCGCRCGEDVRKMLNAVAQQAIAKYKLATQAQRKTACGEITSDFGIPSGGTGRITHDGWDINPLVNSEEQKLAKRFGPGDDIQIGTVTVDGQCYFAGEVNYFLWGVTEALCESSGYGLGLPFDEEDAIWAHRAGKDGWGAFATATARIWWTRAGIASIKPGSLELNENWVAPRIGVTKGRGLTKYTGGSCVPSPNEQPYRAGLSSFKWRWGGSGSPFYGTVAPLGKPKTTWICAYNDNTTAMLGQSGILVAMAPNDIGVYPNLGVGVKSHGAFQPIASYDVDGVPHVELSSTIPTAFSPTETVTYTYQPDEGGIPENLEALIEITPICPIPESDRSSANYCGCSGGRNWNAATQECEFLACGDADHVPCDNSVSDPYRAMGLNCPGELQVNATTTADPEAVGVRSSFGETGIFDPREGSQYAVIGSGVVAELNNVTPQGDDNFKPTHCNDSLANAQNPGGNLPAPLKVNPAEGDCTQGAGLGTGDCSATLQGQFTQGGAYNYNELRFTLQVPPGVTSFSYDFAFFSVEYPAYYGSSYNDTYIGWLESEKWTGNISFDQNGSPISLNASILAFKDDSGNSPVLAGTCMRQHASTNWLTTTAGVTPGETITVVLAIFDLTDSSLDSYAFIDNFKWGCEPIGKPQTTPSG